MDDNQGGSRPAPMLPPPVCSYGSPEQLAALYCALAKAQGEFQPIEKNRSVTIDIKNEQRQKIGQYQFRYADLEEITAKTRPALSKHGLATIQPIGPAKHGSGIALFTQLIHENGGMLISELSVTTGQRDIKALGAEISYLRRYAKSAMLDIAADDDMDEQNNQQSPDGDEPEPEQRAGQVTRSAPDPEADDGFYSDEQFRKSLTGWEAAIKTGKSTADRIISIASSKRKLTDEQIKHLKSIQPENEQ